MCFTNPMVSLRLNPNIGFQDVAAFLRVEGELGEPSWSSWKGLRGCTSESSINDSSRNSVWICGSFGIFMYLYSMLYILCKYHVLVVWARRKLVSDSITRWPSVRVDIYVFLQLNNDKIIWTYQEKQITSFGSGICSTLTRRIDPFHWRHPSWESQSSLTRDLKLEAELLWMSGAHHSSLCTCLRICRLYMCTYIHICGLDIFGAEYVCVIMCVYIHIDVYAYLA